MLKCFIMLLAVTMMLAWSTQAFAVDRYVNGSCGQDIWTGLNDFCLPSMGPKKTIQDAIDDASDGDVIHVAPGTYTEDIDLQGKEILLLADPGDASDTIIMGTGTESVVTCASGETANTIIDGFTITGGIGHVVGFGRRGAGLYIPNGDPVIRNCIVENNDLAGNSLESRGGGAYCFNSDAQFIECEFRNNVDGPGAGCYAVNGAPVFDNCLFDSNDMNSLASGGGLNLLSTNAIVVNCIFRQNSASTSGGGIHASNNSVIIANCRFEFNESSIAVGGGVALFDITAFVINCVFLGNEATGSGGGAFIDGSDADFANCTFTGNTSSQTQGGAGGAAFVKDTSECDFRNCIFWRDDPDEIVEDTATATVTYSIVQGGWAGIGNIDFPPCFVDEYGPDDTPSTGDEDLRLRPGSIAIDAGDSFSVPPDLADVDGDSNTFEQTPLDLGGDPRMVDALTHPNNGNPLGPLTVDMGAYEAPEAIAAPCPGDINGSQVVDQDDLNLVLGNWGNEVPPGRNGDANCDGIVDQIDLNLVLGNWGNDCT